MREVWAANVRGKMHLYGIKVADVAARLDVTATYIGAILNGHRHPKGGRERVEQAVDTIIQEIEAKG